MTSITPRPMSTPDLAGILGRPRRRVQEPPPRSSEPVEDATSFDTSQAGGAADAAAPVRDSPVASISSARQSRSRTDSVDDAAAAASTPTTGTEGIDTEDSRRYLRTMTVYLPRSTYRRLQVEAESRQLSRTALLLISVNEVHDRLPDLLAETPRPKGALFDVPQARAPKEEPNTQTSIRVTDQQLSILEALAKQYGTTRSRVLCAAFDAYVS